MCVCVCVCVREREREREFNYYCVLFTEPIAHFQKGWQTGTRVGARSIMGSFGGTIMRAKIFLSTQSSVYCSCVSEKILAHATVPPKDPIIERVPTLVTCLGSIEFD